MSPRPATLSGEHAEPVRSRAAAYAASLVLALLTLVLGPGAGPAAAHDTLLGTDPPDGAVLAQAPDALVLTFSSDQLAVGTAVAVTGPDGTAWADGEPMVDGPTVTQPLAAQMPSGAYAVEWRSVSSDGHPVSGTMTFALELPEPLTTPEPTLEDEPAPSAEPSAQAEVDVSTPTTEASEAGDGAAADGVQQPDGAIGWPWVAAALALAVVAALATLIALRRRAAKSQEEQRG